MLYRLNKSDLTFIKSVSDLDNRIVVYYGECTLCSFYKRLSYSHIILRAALVSHIVTEHNLSLEEAEKNITYKSVGIDKNQYLSLHDIVLID